MLVYQRVTTINAEYGEFWASHILNTFLRHEGCPNGGTSKTGSNSFKHDKMKLKHHKLPVYSDTSFTGIDIYSYIHAFYCSWLAASQHLLISLRSVFISLLGLQQTADLGTSRASCSVPWRKGSSLTCRGVRGACGWWWSGWQWNLKPQTKDIKGSKEAIPFSLISKEASKKNDPPIQIDPILNTKITSRHNGSRGSQTMLIRYDSIKHWLLMIAAWDFLKHCLLFL